MIDVVFKMVSTLERIASDSKVRRAMEEEEFAALDTAFCQAALAQKDKALATRDKALATRDKELKKALARIAELERKYEIN